MDTALQGVAKLGQSIWLDTIGRGLLTSGELDSWLERGVSGVTTNPVIFENAIAKTDAYDDDIRMLAAEGQDVDGVYGCLTLADVGAAADILLPVYERSEGLDGFVSLEVSPFLAADAGATFSEACRLFGALARPNVMIKIPATKAGVEALEHCIAEGINVNSTLIFSMEQYEAVAGAYRKGIEKRIEAGKKPNVSSVASVFVRRVDSAVDPLVEQKDPSLAGHIGIDNARRIYRRFRELFSDGGPVQRPLWASTGTTNPAYSDVLYVDSLIGADTINTVPPKTLEAFCDHGKVTLSVEEDPEGAERRIRRLRELGVDFDEVCRALLREGLQDFSNAFVSLNKSIEEKMRKCNAISR